MCHCQTLAIVFLHKALVKTGAEEAREEWNIELVFVVKEERD